MSDDVIGLTLMVAMDEDGHPVVCGAWETNLLDIIGRDEVNALFAKARDAWLPDYVAWRDIEITVDRAAVIAAFRQPPINAIVLEGDEA